LLPFRLLTLIPFSGITGGYGGDRRVEYILQPEDRAKGSYSFVIESSCNGMFGVPWNGDTIAPPDVSILDGPPG
jgi:alpha-mannosidase